MNHLAILSPSIYFFENQTKLFENLLKNPFKHINKVDDFFHFDVNGKAYTYIISVTNKYKNIFVKGHTIGEYKNEDVIFQTFFNILEGAKQNKKELSEVLLKIAGLNKVSYHDLGGRNSRLDNFSSFDKEAFKDFTSLLNNKDENDFSGNELFELYLTEYALVTETIKYKIHDLNTTLSLEKFSSKSKIDKLLDSGLFARIDDLLIYNRDSWCDIIQVNDDSITFYEINKDKVLSGYSEEKYEDNNTIFFTNEDFLNRTKELKELLRDFKVGYISNETFDLNILDSFYVLNSIVDVNYCLFKYHNHLDENKKVSPSDFSYLSHLLLSSNSYFWANDSLYDPNKVVGIDYSSLSSFIEKPSNEYLVVCSSELMTSYTKKISNEWKKAIDDALVYAKEIADNQKEENFKSIALENYDSMLKYRSNRK